MRVIFGSNNEKLKNTHGAFEYIWTRLDGQSLDGKSEDDEIERICLEDSAITEINEMLVEGFQEGTMELLESINFPKPIYSGTWGKISD